MNLYILGCYRNGLRIKTGKRHRSSKATAACAHDISAVAPGISNHFFRDTILQRIVALVRFVKAGTLKLIR